MAKPDTDIMILKKQLLRKFKKIINNSTFNDLLDIDDKLENVRKG